MSWIDLNDDDVRGGELTDVTLGVNWYMNAYAKVQFNYIHAFLDNPTFGDSDTGIYAARCRWTSKQDHAEIQARCVHCLLTVPRCGRPSVGPSGTVGRPCPSTGVPRCS